MREVKKEEREEKVRETKGRAFGGAGGGVLDPTGHEVYIFLRSVSSWRKNQVPWQIKRGLTERQRPLLRGRMAWPRGRFLPNTMVPI